MGWLIKGYTVRASDSCSAESSHPSEIVAVRAACRASRQSGKDYVVETATGYPLAYITRGKRVAL
jgi:hypothetical protein